MQLGRHRGQGQRRGLSNRASGSATSVVSFPYGAAAPPTGMQFNYIEGATRTVTGSPLSFSFSSLPTVTGITENNVTSTATLTSAVNAVVAAGAGVHKIIITADFSVSSVFMFPDLGPNATCLVVSDRHSTLNTDVPYSGDYINCTKTNRIETTDTTCFRTITSTQATSGNCIGFDQGAEGWWFDGIAFTRTQNANDSLVDIGVYITMTQESHMPHRLALTRCILDAAEKSKRGLSLNGKDILVAGCTIINATSSPQGYTDSQAISLWRGGKALAIFNNACSGESEIIALGGTGGAISIPNFIPGTDVLLARNHLYKPVTWDSDVSYPLKKNIFETKQTERVLVFGNVCDNYKSSNQGQFHQFVLKAETDSGNDWIYTRDLILLGNLSLNGTEGGPFQISPQGSNSNTHLGMARLTIVHTYFKHGSNDSASDIPFGSTTGNYGIDDFCMAHNTMPLREAWFVIDQATQNKNAFARARIVDNASWKAAQFGPVFASNGTNKAITDATFNTGYVFSKNAQVSGSASWATGGSLLASPHNCIQDTSANMFVDAANGDFSAKASGPLDNTATDGFDIGADKAWVDSITTGLY